MLRGGQKITWAVGSDGQLVLTCPNLTQRTSMSMVGGRSEIVVEEDLGTNVHTKTSHFHSQAWIYMSLTKSSTPKTLENSIKSWSGSVAHAHWELLRDFQCNRRLGPCRRQPGVGQRSPSYTLCRSAKTGTSETVGRIGRAEKAIRNAASEVSKVRRLEGWKTPGDCNCSDVITSTGSWYENQTQPEPMPTLLLFTCSTELRINAWSTSTTVGETSSGSGDRRVEIGKIVSPRAPAHIPDPAIDRGSVTSTIWFTVPLGAVQVPSQNNMIVRMRRVLQSKRGNCQLYLL